MARYRSNLSERELNYSDSGGPIVGPGEEFEHDIPKDVLADHLRMGFIAPVAIDEGESHAHASRSVFDALQHAPGRREPLHVRIDDND